MMTKSEMITEKMGHEMKVNPPSILAKTKKKFGAKRAEAQRRAILLSKARSKGAKIPMPHEEAMTAVHQATA